MKKITDKMIVLAVHLYRQQPLVENRHGPTSLEELGRFIQLLYREELERPPSKSILSYRLTNERQTGLYDLGYLGGVKSDAGLMAFTLYVTEDGRKKFLENDNGDVEGA